MTRAQRQATSATPRQRRTQQQQAQRQRRAQRELQQALRIHPGPCRSPALGEVGEVGIE